MILRNKSSQTLPQTIVYRKKKVE